MDRDFIIDGTGRVVRAGDRVFVRQAMLTDSGGPGVVIEIANPFIIAVLLDSGVTEYAMATRIKREDDEETSGGSPLWCWR